MKKISNTIQTFLALATMMALIVVSYLNESIFMDRILPCCFILSVIMFARIRGGVNRIVTEEKAQ